MNAINNLFNQDIPSLILGIFIIMSGIVSAVNIVGRFSEVIGKPMKWIKRKNADHELIMQTINTVKDLQEKHDKSVKQSIMHDKTIEESVLALSDKVGALSDSLNEMRTEQDNDKLAEYKDKIGRSYRYYIERKSSNQVPFWNQMEKEALEGLIEQYEAHGGKNSFVHSVVEPEIQTWKIID